MKHFEIESYIGTGWEFPPRFDLAKKEVEMATEEEEIHQSLLILFTTTPGERVMNPEYGCNLRSMVFEGIDETAKTKISNLIHDAILFFETRITVNHIEVSDVEFISGSIKITVSYTIRTTNTRGNMVYPFYLEEGNR